MVRVLIALLCVGATATSAFAQGYARENLSDAWCERPAEAPSLDAETVSVLPLPFEMQLYGKRADALTVSPSGWAQPGSHADAAVEAAHDLDGAIVVQPWPGLLERTWAWIEGEAPTRRFVVQWDADGRGLDAQLQLEEDGHAVTFAYRAGATTGDSKGPGERRGRGNRRRIDELGGERVVLLDPRARSTTFADVRFTPRAPLFNPPDIGKEGVATRWQDVRKESTVPDGCTKRCTYLARGRGYFHVRDRAVFWHSPRGVRKHPPEFLERLLEEDRETFGSENGDAFRWVRQVLDGKVLLLPADGSEPLRLWFRIVEYFSLDDRGTTLADHHVWNLRWMLSNAFPGDDPREDVDRYYAWRASAEARLTVGKLFRADQADDAGRQYDSGRKNEYVLWSGRLKTDTRGALAPNATPEDGWVRFTLMEDDMRVTQHADAADLRFVADPNYVDGHYEYVIRALDNPYGWVTGRTVPHPPLRDEPFDTDPGRETGPVTPR
jgi:hypothetical protein